MDYQLGNKAKDLLEYTMTVTKPIGEKTLGLKDYAKALRSIANLSSEEYHKTCIEAAEKVERFGKKQGFPKSAVHTYIKEMRACSVNIVRDTWAANDVDFKRYPWKRIDYIQSIIRECGLMLRLIDISYELGYINMKRMEYWTTKVTDVKYMAQSWVKKEFDRAKEIKRNEKEEEYRLIAEILADAISQRL